MSGVFWIGTGCTVLFAVIIAVIMYFWSAEMKESEFHCERARAWHLASRYRENNMPSILKSFEEAVGIVEILYQKMWQTDEFKSYVEDLLLELSKLKGTFPSRS